VKGSGGNIPTCLRWEQEKLDTCQDSQDFNRVLRIQSRLANHLAAMFGEIKKKCTQKETKNKDTNNVLHFPAVTTLKRHSARSNETHK
jgi:hypothetical protein